MYGSICQFPNQTRNHESATDACGFMQMKAKVSLATAELQQLRSRKTAKRARKRF